MIIQDDEFVGQAVIEKTGGKWYKGRGKALGNVLNGKLVSGSLYQDFNGVNVVCHMFGEGNWATRDYLHAIFDYPFNVMGVRRITAPIHSANKRCISMVQKMGFELEATLHQENPDGDLLIFKLLKEKARYLRSDHGRRI